MLRLALRVACGCASVMVFVVPLSLHNKNTRQKLGAIARGRNRTPLRFVLSCSPRLSPLAGGSRGDSIPTSFRYRYNSSPSSRPLSPSVWVTLHNSPHFVSGMPADIKLCFPAGRLFMAAGVGSRSFLPCSAPALFCCLALQSRAGLFQKLRFAAFL